MSSSKKKRVVVVETEETYSKPSYQKRICLAERNMLTLKLNWQNEVADAIYNFDGHIIVDNDKRWSIPDVKKLLGEPRCEARFIDRLRLVDLYFKIKYPLIARHFDK